VFDADAPSSKLAMEQFGQNVVRARLLKIAICRTPSRADAEDLMAAALMRILDPDDRPWNPARGAFVGHFALVMRQTWDEDRRRVAHERTVSEADLDTPIEPASSDPPADEEHVRRITFAGWMAALDDVLAEIGDKHPRARQLVDVSLQGFDEVADQARLMGCTVREVQSARKILEYHAPKALARRLEQEERDRKARRAADEKRERTRP